MKYLRRRHLQPHYVAQLFVFTPGGSISSPGRKKIHSNKFINLPAHSSIHIYVVFIIYINCRLTVSPCSSVFKYTNTNTQIQIHKYKSRITSIQIHKVKYKCIKSYTRSAHLLSMLWRAMHLRLTFNRRLFLRQGGCVRHKPKLATLSFQIFSQISIAYIGWLYTILARCGKVAGSGINQNRRHFL